MSARRCSWIYEQRFPTATGVREHTPSPSAVQRVYSLLFRGGDLDVVRHADDAVRVFRQPLGLGLLVRDRPLQVNDAVLRVDVDRLQILDPVRLQLRLHLRRQLFAAARELVALAVDVLVSAGTAASSAAKKATTAGPVVSLRRPGGNMTGITADAAFEMPAKRLQLLREAAPRRSHV